MMMSYKIVMVDPVQLLEYQAISSLANEWNDIYTHINE